MLYRKSKHTFCGKKYFFRKSCFLRDMWKNIAARSKVWPGAEVLLITDYVTVQTNRFEYFITLPVVKLSANSHVLISLYQPHSHTCWIAGKHYHSLYKQLHVDMCGRLRIVYLCLTGPTDNVGQGWRGDFTGVYWRITWSTQTVCGIW
jgi:hypothetical protein